MTKLTSPSLVNLKIQELRERQKAVDSLIRALGRYQRVSTKLEVGYRRPQDNPEWSRRLAS